MGALALSRQALRFRGKSYLALVLAPAQPLEAWLEELADLSGRSPGFFTSRSVVLDLSDIRLPQTELKSLLTQLERIGIRIMGIEGVREEDIPAGLPPLLQGGRNTGLIGPGTKGKKEAPVAPPPPAGSLVVDSVRSGQSIVYPEGDVTVVGAVASGAEVVASGSVHIYGTLRGRVIAGAYGSPKARIFCRKLEAEFLAIDAVYLVAEKIEPQFTGQSVQVWAEQDIIKLGLLR